MWEWMSQYIPLFQALNSKVSFYIKLNVNFNSTKVTKSFESVKYLKGSHCPQHKSLIYKMVHQMDCGQVEESLVIFPSMSC